MASLSISLFSFAKLVYKTSRKGLEKLQNHSIFSVWRRKLYNR